ncbi:MAG TPA: Gfo/Idh/MocA family oxidoreductase, partial [Spirochaetota bacterium]|nr:Gfo/Idh/MocA family oxidoreductase [Spirochaetota bacterium]
MEKINVGFIGCGRISDLHYPGYKSAGEARVYAVCDADPDTAAARKRQWKAAKAYTDYRELLADPAVDAVEILT